MIAFIKNERLGNFPVRPNHTMLKGMNVGLCIVISSINSVKLVTQNYEKKVTLFSKYVLLKKVAVPTSKKYIF